MQRQPAPKANGEWILFLQMVVQQGQGAVAPHTEDISTSGNAGLAGKALFGIKKVKKAIRGMREGVCCSHSIFGFGSVKYCYPHRCARLRLHFYLMYKALFISEFLAASGWEGSRS